VHLARGDPQAHAIERRDGGESLADLVDFEHGAEDSGRTGSARISGTGSRSAATR
jgi:hypothetical protein